MTGGAALLATTSPVLWFTTRATGTVTIVLLTASVVLGVLTTTRASAPGVPRFALSEFHRRVALMALAFLALHVLTAVVDTYVPIGWVSAVVPFVSKYQPLWIGLGAVAFDLMIAVTVTSLLRRQLGARLFRLFHWAVYVCWPFAIAHGIGAGTDLRFGWMQVLIGGCVGSVVVAVAWRLWAHPYRGGYRTAAPRSRSRARAVGADPESTAPAAPAARTAASIGSRSDRSTVRAPR
jgi:methionine sulfoxide reductase heme-binding subunit